jgi:hypothetical protein
MRILKAGVVYFLILFAFGWVLGPIRVLWAVPRFGQMTALLFEAAIMLIAMFFSARWIIQRFEVSLLPARIATGLVALGILLPAEMAGALWVRGLPIRDFVATFARATGAISLVMFLLFAAMPTLVNPSRR